jgi:DNA polymerase III subunit epsilon
MHWTDTLAVFDTETTGIDTRTDRLVTAYVGVVGAAGEVIESHEWLANPGVEIPERAAAVHGITTERAVREGADAKTVVSEVVETLRDMLSRGLPLVAYNASFDLSLLYHEAIRHGVEPLSEPKPVVDPLVVDRALDQYRKGKRTLESVSAHYGVINPAAHDARGDAVTTGLVVQKMATVFPDAFSVEPDTLHDQQIEWARAWEENFYDFLERNGKPRPRSRGQWPNGR